MVRMSQSLTTVYLPAGLVIHEAVVKTYSEWITVPRHTTFYCSGNNASDSLNIQSENVKQDNANFTEKNMRVLT